MDIIKELTGEIVAFRDARDWARFHTASNLAVSIAIEASELMECYQWILDDEPAKRADIMEEIADVAIYMLLFCDANGIDLADAIRDKLAMNGRKYPIEKAKGRATKHDKL